MGIVAMLLSVLFRIQLAWPGESSNFLSFFLGEQWAPNGVLEQNMYLGLVTIHGTIMVFFLLTGGLSGTFSNILIPLQLGARDMASGFLNMLSFWFFFISPFVRSSSINARVRNRNDFVVVINGDFYCGITDRKP
jgi:cytochrome c oxidase subunit I